MTRGRPPLNEDIVDHLDGSEDARWKMKLILQTISGQIDIDTACRQLGIGKRAFHKLRARVLQTAVECLEPHRRGRPRLTSKEETEIEQLRRKNHELTLAVRSSQIREEIAMLMPNILKPIATDTKPDPRKKKKRTTRNRQARMPR